MLVLQADGLRNSKPAAVQNTKDDRHDERQRGMPPRTELIAAIEYPVYLTISKNIWNEGIGFCVHVRRGDVGFTADAIKVDSKLTNRIRPASAVANAFVRAFGTP